jgi:hypothetical protein
MYCVYTRIAHVRNGIAVYNTLPLRIKAALFNLDVAALLRWLACGRGAAAPQLPPRRLATVWSLSCGTARAALRAGKIAGIATLRTTKALVQWATHNFSADVQLALGIIRAPDAAHVQPHECQSCRDASRTDRNRRRADPDDTYSPTAGDTPTVAVPAPPQVPPLPPAPPESVGRRAVR